MNNCGLMIRTVIIALLSIGTWVTIAVAGMSNEFVPQALLDSINGGIAIEKVDFCCHKPADGVCRPLSSRNNSALLIPKKSALDPPPVADLAYTDLMPHRLLRNTGTIYGPDLPRSIVTTPIYLTTLRLRL
jgi:hypothetical protein